MEKQRVTWRLISSEFGINEIDSLIIWHRDVQLCFYV
jgi:hypothetical protein